MTRREVRVTPGFFDQLDALPQFFQTQSAQRGGGVLFGSAGGSSTDFAAFVLPEIVDRFAEQFDEMPESIAGVSAMRVYIGSGVLVRGVAVVGLLISDGTVELVGLGIDR